MRIAGRRVASIAIAATGLAILTGSSSAMATQTDLYACQYSMRATTYFVGLTFSTSGAFLPTVCVATRVNGNDVQGVASTVVNISGSGSSNIGYNVACETGVVYGSMSMSPSTGLATVGSPPPPQLSASFTMTVVAGQGTLNLYGVANGQAAGAGEGYVAMVPDDPKGPCLGLSPSNPAQFMLEGAFTAALRVG